MEKKSRPEKYQRIAMACQGGGSLGAYHMGALKAMDEFGYSPDIVAGISVGAFTAALISGNNPKERIAKMEEFWDKISWPEFPWAADALTEIRKLHNTLSSLQGFFFGQPNFFTPRIPPPTWQPSGTLAATSYYDTSLMRETLLELVDFDGINSGKKGRIILGATRVKDDKLIFFDSAQMKIGPEHVMASAAMPPGFPGQIIDGELYWDGGCSSNTPLTGIFQAEAKVHTLCFMVDLYAPNGKEPKNMEEVMQKLKEIQYTSRTDHHIIHIANQHNLAKGLNHMFSFLPDNLKKDPIVIDIMDMASDILFDVVHLAYDKPPYEVISSDCEFSKSSLQDRALHGYNDMKAVIDHSPWLEERAPHHGTRVHKYVGGKPV